MFGVRLLNRTTRSVALTEAGAELLAHLNPVLEGVDKAIDAVNAFRDTPAGVLRLVAHPVAAATVVAPLVARFAAAYPAIRLEISVDRERKDIVSERFDAGIHFGDGVLVGNEAIADPPLYRGGAMGRFQPKSQGVARVNHPFTITC